MGSSMGDNITCTWISGETLLCNGMHFVEKEDPLTYKDKMFWVWIGIYTLLVLIAGLMSGLTMGLLSLDLTSLQVLAEGGKPNERRYAKRIIPVVKHHHLLLVTLLLANAAAVESMPLFLDKVAGTITAIVVSVTAVLFFGEVIPQAICTRYGLAVGANLAWLVQVLMVLTFPISWPISKLLDCVLGKEGGTFFRRAELKVLVDLHRQSEEENEEPLSNDEAMIIKGALSLSEKEVKAAFTPLESLFAISIDKNMDYATIEEIVQRGHSRVPVYEGEKSNLVGLLLIKNLIHLDPKEAMPVTTVFQLNKRELPRVVETMPLYDLLNLFQLGRSHMCAVVSENSVSEYTDFGDTSTAGEVIGIITLEDVIEELIQEEIVDETDVYIDVHKRVKVARALVRRSSFKHSHSTAQALNAMAPRVSLLPPISGSPGPNVTPTLSTTPDIYINSSDTEPLLK